MGGRQLILDGENMIRLSYDELPRVTPKLRRMLIQMRMEMLLRNKFGSTDAELELEQKFQEMGELEDIEGYRFCDEIFRIQELFMVETEIEEFPGESIPVRMECN